MSEKWCLPRTQFEKLFEVLRNADYTVVAPTLRDGAIIYDIVNSPEDLPIGWTEEQTNGKYRIKQRDDQALFGYVVGPHSWKKYLFPPQRRLWAAQKTGGHITLKEEPLPQTRFAFLGIRSCEIHALDIQDKVFLGKDFQDSYYKKVREELLLIAINCGQAGGTCFCVSMQTGPRTTTGYDLCLTERLVESSHYFLVEANTQKGRSLINKLSLRKAMDDAEEQIEATVEKARQGMKKTLNTDGIRDLLFSNAEHPHWQNIASRCLSCANCTLACPTCFCSTVEETTDLSGENAERWKKWDSCFIGDFSFVHGGTIRVSTHSRYRQWMTHKLSSWQDQFGSSGCVGCGRCITWCPVGIDITEESEAIRQTPIGESHA